MSKQNRNSKKDFKKMMLGIFFLLSTHSTAAVSEEHLVEIGELTTKIDVMIKFLSENDLSVLEFKINMEKIYTSAKVIIEESNNDDDKNQMLKILTENLIGSIDYIVLNIKTANLDIKEKYIEIIETVYPLIEMTIRDISDKSIIDQVSERAINHLNPILSYLKEAMEVPMGNSLEYIFHAEMLQTLYTSSRGIIEHTNSHDLESIRWAENMINTLNKAEEESQRREQQKKPYYHTYPHHRR